MIVEEEIQQITQSIWMSILSFPVDVAEVDRGELERSNTRKLTGCVHLTGDWEGAVLLFCSLTLARRAASVMFDTDPADLTLEEIQDALGELTNMTAGNVKSLLPGSSRISLPSVVEGTDYKLMVPRSVPVAEVGFSSGGEPLVVTLLRSVKES